MDYEYLKTPKICKLVAFINLAFSFSYCGWAIYFLIEAIESIWFFSCMLLAEIFSIPFHFCLYYGATDETNIDYIKKWVLFGIWFLLPYNMFVLFYRGIFHCAFDSPLSPLELIISLSIRTYLWLIVRQYRDIIIAKYKRKTMNYVTPHQVYTPIDMKNIENTPVDVQPVQEELQNNSTV